MKTPLNALFAAAGIAAVLLTGCVSSKKYKSSQAALQQVRNDSTRLAQQVTSLNENVQTLEQKNTTLQRSLDSSSNNYAAQQKSLENYQNYFNKRQGTLSQVSEQLKSALSQAGIENEDVQQTSDAVYVSLDENKIFKKNSTAVTPNGKQALNSLAQVIKDRPDVNVVVSDGDSSGGQRNMAGNMPASSGMENPAANATSDKMSANTTPRHRTHHVMRNDHAQNNATGSANEKAAATTGHAATTTDHVATAHKRAQKKYSSSEGAMTYSSNWPKTSKNRSWVIQQGRVNTVANGLLQNGVPKVNVLLQQPGSNGAEHNNGIKVIITPVISDFNPQKNASAKVETR